MDKRHEITRKGYTACCGCVLLTATLFVPVIARSEVAADSTGIHAPRIETTANGLPLVQINTPSAAGVSRNQYQRFDVDPQGTMAAP
ncbi:MAG: hypothetical protein AB1810_12630 [Pseudomonadota bacterium]